MKKCKEEKSKKEINKRIMDKNDPRFMSPEQKQIVDLILSNNEFTRRVCIVILLNYYIDDEHIDICLNAIKDLNDDSFYVNMAISWHISLSFIRFRSKTLTLLKSKVLPVFVQNKAISKIRDSYRVTEKDKELVKNLRL